MGTFVLL